MPDEAAPRLFHLFALLPAGLPPLGEVAGLEGGAVRTVQAGRVVAVVQPVDAALVERLRGPATQEAQLWVTERLLDHERVVEACAALGPVFPVGFGVLVADLATLPLTLAEHAEALDAHFARVAGKEEWCLKVLMKLDLPSRGDAARAAANGRAYLAARRAVPEQVRSKEQAAAAFVETAVMELGDLLTDLVVRDAGLSAGLPDKRRLVSNLALLVPHASRTAFVERTQALAKRAERQDLELTLTGPWPAYSFRPKINLAGGS